MSEAWRNHYDRWRLASPPEGPLDDDGEPIDQDELDAQAEDAEIERAERMREDRMFDEADKYDDLERKATDMTEQTTETSQYAKLAYAAEHVLSDREEN